MLLTSCPVEAGLDLTSVARAEPPLLVPYGTATRWGPVSSSPLRLMLGPLGKVPRLLPDWQLHRGLKEGSLVLASDAFSVDITEGLTIAL